MRVLDLIYRRRPVRTDRSRHDPFAGFSSRDWADLPTHHPASEPVR